MLWDIIRDFFVQHIFGGEDSMGFLHDITLGNGDLYGTDVKIHFANLTDYNGELNYSLSDYLSTIASIITIVVILLICCALIKKIYNMCAHIIG